MFDVECGSFGCYGNRSSKSSKGAPVAPLVSTLRKAYWWFGLLFGMHFGVVYSLPFSTRKGQTTLFAYFAVFVDGDASIRSWIDFSIGW